MNVDVDNDDNDDNNNDNDDDLNQNLKILHLPMISLNGHAPFSSGPCSSLPEHLFNLYDLTSKPIFMFLTYHQPVHICPEISLSLRKALSPRFCLSFL